MEERNVKLSIDKAKEWYKQGGELREIALQAYKEEELKDNRPHSWREFCENFPVKDGECYINVNSYILNYCSSTRKRKSELDSNLCINKEETQAFLALMQLRQLRNAWIGDWKPNWMDVQMQKYTIEREGNGIRITKYFSTYRSLSFPTEEMAEDFSTCFAELIKLAEPLL